MLLALGLVLLAGTGVAGADEPAGFQIDFASKGQRASATDAVKAPPKKSGRGILGKEAEAATPAPSDGKQANTAWATGATGSKARPAVKKCQPGPVPCRTPR
jgi:hypothetical protein